MNQIITNPNTNTQQMNNDLDHDDFSLLVRPKLIRQERIYPERTSPRKETESLYRFLYRRYNDDTKKFDGEMIESVRDFYAGGIPNPNYRYDKNSEKMIKLENLEEIQIEKNIHTLIESELKRFFPNYNTNAKFESNNNESTNNEEIIT